MLVAKFSGRLDERPASGSLGLLPSGPDPVGEGYVHRQPPGLIMERRAANYNRKTAQLRDEAKRAGPEIKAAANPYPPRRRQRTPSIWLCPSPSGLGAASKPRWWQGRLGRALVQERARGGACQGEEHAPCAHKPFRLLAERRCGPCVARSRAKIVRGNSSIGSVVAFLLGLVARRAALVASGREFSRCLALGIRVGNVRHACNGWCQSGTWPTHPATW